MCLGRRSASKTTKAKAIPKSPFCHRLSELNHGQSRPRIAGTIREGLYRLIVFAGKGWECHREHGAAARAVVGQVALMSAHD